VKMFHENVQSNFGDARRVPRGPPQCQALSHIGDSPKSHKRSINETGWPLSQALQEFAARYG
jgi:hypothetical protein